jgi:hypothetical protein
MGDVNSLLLNVACLLEFLKRGDWYRQLLRLGACSADIIEKATRLKQLRGCQSSEAVVRKQKQTLLGAEHPGR